MMYNILKKRKMKKFTYIITVLFVSVLFISKTNAQFVHPAICTDYVAGQSDNVINTGNDLRDFYSNPGYEMRITVWDGDSPGFGWYDSLNNSYGSSAFNGGSSVKDPDVVLYHNPGNNMQALMVYERNNNIYYEVWEYVAPNWSTITSSTAITTSGEASNPNIDVQKIAWSTILVYQDGERIYCRASQSFGSFNAANFVDDGKTPDVAVNNWGTNPSAKIVVSYIKDYGNNSNLKVANKRVDYVINNWFTFSTSTLNTATTPNGEYFGRPRIAAPNWDDLGTKYQIVVEHFDGGSRWFIEGYNDNNSNIEIINSTDNASDLTGVSNSEPVVTYIGEMIIVNWTYDDSNNGFTSSTMDVLSRQLEMSDGSTSPNTPFLEYSTVNRYYLGRQYAPSVAGRYSSANNKLSSFYNSDQSINRVFFKSRTCDKIQFRTGITSVDSKIYPNPTSKQLYIDLGAEFKNTQLEIFNIQGQNINTFEFNDNMYVIDVSNYTKGIYQLRIIRNNETEIKSFIVQ